VGGPASGLRKKATRAGICEGTSGELNTASITAKVPRHLGKALGRRWTHVQKALSWWSAALPAWTAAPGHLHQQAVFTWDKAGSAQKPSSPAAATAAESGQRKPRRQPRPRLARLTFPA